MVRGKGARFHAAGQEEELYCCWTLLSSRNSGVLLVGEGLATCSDSQVDSANQRSLQLSAKTERHAPQALL